MFALPKGCEYHSHDERMVLAVTEKGYHAFSRRHHFLPREQRAAVDNREVW